VLIRRALFFEMGLLNQWPARIENALGYNYFYNDFIFYRGFPYMHNISLHYPKKRAETDFRSLLFGYHNYLNETLMG